VSEMLDAALRYADNGWPVFPLQSNRKEPATEHGCKDATTDQAQLRAWFANGRRCNVGVATGNRSGLLVIDIDVKKGVDGFATLAKLEAELGSISDTRTVATPSGGAHLYLSVDQELRCSTGTLGPGIDVRCDGGYVVAPPSWITTTAYRWEDDGPILPLPVAWVTRIQETRSGGDFHELDAQPVPIGQQEDVLNRRACSYRHHGLSRAGALAALWADVQTWQRDPAQRPWTPADVVTKVDRAWRDIEPGVPGAPDADTKGPNCTDVGNAWRFAQLCRGHVRHCHPWGQWLTWDGRRWQRDDTKRIWRLARKTVVGILKEAAQEADSDRRGRLAKWAIASESRALLANMVELASSEPDIPVVPAELDVDPWLLNCRNGTVDLRTGGLRPPDPADLITKLAPVVYDPDAACPTWEAFLTRIMGGKAELIDYLQRVVGSALVGEQVDHALFFLYGLGANGKSTFISALLAVLGDYGKQVAPDLLMYSDYDRHPTGLADLFGVRLAASTEVEAGRRLAEVLVKQLTGGDRVKARYMHRDFFEFDPSHTIMLAANHKPVIYGGDHAMWRRIRLIPFAVTIPTAEQNPRLGKKLCAELPGILAWAVRGCLDWQHGGLQDPAEVIAATAAYRAEMDALGTFIATCCEVRKNLQVTAGALYKAYKSWADAEGEKPVSQRALALRLEERGFQRGKDAKSRRCWFGIGLNPSSPDTSDRSPGNFSRERVLENLPEHLSDVSGTAGDDASEVSLSKGTAAVLATFPGSKLIARHYRSTPSDSVAAWGSQ
jgi:putative DNA primase/helicase